MTALSTAVSPGRHNLDLHLDLDAELASLVQEALAHPAVRHPFLTRFAAGAFRDQSQALRRYAVEYSGYASWFPHYLRAVISRLPRADQREMLMHNLEEEQGQLGADDCQALLGVGINPATVLGIPHPVLFRRFCQSIGIQDEELAQPTMIAARWRTRFLHFLKNATAAQAVGALGLGTERIVRPVYEKLLGGIIGLGTLRRDEFVFFELHCLVDDQHQQDLLAIARDLAEVPGGIAQLRSGMMTALDLRCEFWDHLYRSILDADLANPA
jgi:pyrroloquinoline quinone (PQQ) biosynthesis protein C